MIIMNCESTGSSTVQSVTKERQYEEVRLKLTVDKGKGKGQSNGEGRPCISTKRVIGPERRNGRKMYIAGSEMIPQEMRPGEVQAWVDEAIKEGGTYPPTRMREFMHATYGRLETKPVPEVNGMGCFLRADRRSIKEGELVGIYEGEVVSHGGEYAMQLRDVIVDGHPDKLQFSQMSRINDDTDDHRMCNCKIGEGGLIIATAIIRPGQQLLMDYGPDYDWDHVKIHNVHALGEVIARAAQELHVEGYDEEIQLIKDDLGGMTAKWRSEMTAYGWGTLITNAIDGTTARTCRHRVNPRRWQRESFPRWIERLMTCTPFPNRIRFGRWKAWVETDWTWTTVRQDAATHRYPRKAHREWDLNEDDGNETLIPLTEVTAIPKVSLWNHEAAPQRRRHTASKLKVKGISTTARTDTDLRTMEYNVGGLNDVQLNDIIDKVAERRIDCAALLDTRKSAIQLKYLKKRITDAVGPGFACFQTEVDPRASGQQRVGGQLWIVNTQTVRQPRYKTVACRGALSYVDATVGGHPIRILATYWPQENDHPQSMWSALGGVEAIPTLKSYMTELISDASTQNRNVIVMGDLNTDVNKKDKHGLRSQMKTWNLNHATEIEKPSWRNTRCNSRIDYIMFRGPTIESLAGDVVSLPSVDFDHFPLVAHFHVDGRTDITKALTLDLARDLNLDDKVTVQKLKRIYDTWNVPQGEAEETIEFIVRNTVKAVRQVQGWRARRKWRDGWSPKMIGLKTALRKCITLRRHLLGQNGHTRWEKNGFSSRRARLCRGWKKALKSYLGESPHGRTTRYALLHDPKYVFSAVTKASYDTAIRNADCWIAKINKQLQGRLRSLYRRQISTAVANREEMREAGRTGKVIKSVMGPFGKARERFLLERLDCGERLISDAATIHNKVTDHSEDGSTGKERSRPTRHAHTWIRTSPYRSISGTKSGRPCGRKLKNTQG